jgi:hypothetical protein
MKQNVIIDTKDGKVKIQFDFCTKCKHYDFCYLDSYGDYHKSTPSGLSEECFDIGKELVKSNEQIRSN